MGTKPIIYKYPLDLSGNNPNNLVIGEPHTLEAGVNRAIVPMYGAVYAESIVVRESSTGRLLIPRDQFKAVHLYQEATQKAGLEVVGAIIVTDPSISQQVEIDYQAVGGEFSYSASNLKQLIDTLDLDARPVRWGDLLGKPNAFPPTMHLHDAGDLYGFEYVVEAIDGLRHAIMVGQEPVLDELRQYISLIHDEMNAKLDIIIGGEFNQQLSDLVARLQLLESGVGFEKHYWDQRGLEHIREPNAHCLRPVHLGLDELTNVRFVQLTDVISEIEHLIP